MTKDQIAQQLKEEFARGNLKPSQLKRSKSTGDILPNLPPPALQKSKSSEDILPEPSELKPQIAALQDELTMERKRIISLKSEEINHASPIKPSGIKEYKVRIESFRSRKANPPSL